MKKQFLMALAALSLLGGRTTAQEPACKPPLMGWSSWNAYRVNISEDIIKHQADLMVEKGLKDAGYTVFGGVNAPYIWLQTPDKMPSWDFFDFLLNKANVVGTPGSGFGPSGEGYFRLTAFGSYENTLEAIERIKAL